MGLRLLRRRRSGRRRICIARVRLWTFCLASCVYSGLVLSVVVLSYIIASRVLFVNVYFYSSSIVIAIAMHASATYGDNRSPNKGVNF